MNEPRQEINWFRATWQVIGVLFLVAVFVAIFFPFYSGGHSGPRTACLSNLKQVSLATLIYEADYDDYLPPYYTFDGKDSEKKFTESIFPYCKNRDIFFCVELKGKWPNSRKVKALEGDNETFGYVHFSSLQGIIPDYATGKRMLLTSSKVIDPATTRYLRDPLATKSKKEKEAALYYSPHGPRFNTTFFDGHAKALPVTNTERDL